MVKYKVGQIIENPVEVEDFKWKVTNVSKYERASGVYLVVAKRIKKDGTLGKQCIRFWSDKPSKSYKRNRSCA